jgi:hypothetical protein
MNLVALYMDRSRCERTDTLETSRMGFHVYVRRKIDCWYISFPENW